MPDPHSDKDQHRFAQIRSRMLDGLARNMPQVYVESSGAVSRSKFRDKLIESDMILTIIDACAYEAQCMEEERARLG